MDITIKDRTLPLELDPFNPCEVYVWGTNANFNLGLGHQTQKNVADLLEVFRKESVFIRAVRLSDQILVHFS